MSNDPRCTWQKLNVYECYSFLGLYPRTIVWENITIQQVKLRFRPTFFNIKAASVRDFIFIILELLMHKYPITSLFLFRFLHSLALLPLKTMQSHKSQPLLNLTNTMLELLWTFHSLWYTPSPCSSPTFHQIEDCKQSKRTLAPFHLNGEWYWQ